MECELHIGKYVEGIGRGKVKMPQERDIDGLRKTRRRLANMCTQNT